MDMKYKDIATVRSQQLIEQNSCCALCGDVIIDDAVLDHDHKTGLVRQVLHRGCNSMLGKIENNMARSRITMDRLDMFAKNLTAYLTKDRELLVHPTHVTKLNKQNQKKAKRR